MQLTKSLLVDHMFTPVSSVASTFVFVAPARYRTEKGTDPESTTSPARFVYAPVEIDFRTNSTFAEDIPPRANVDTKQVYP